jgi:hypothetical protein
MLLLPLQWQCNGPCDPVLHASLNVNNIDLTKKKALDTCTVVVPIYSLRIPKYIEYRFLL